MDPVHTAFLHALSSGYQFTEAFGVVPELDWQLTDAGMVYIATRRAGDLVWIRVCDFMPPNIHQFTREIEEATAPTPASRPVIIRWSVPNDDTHTTNFELAQVDSAWGSRPSRSPSQVSVNPTTAPMRSASAIRPTSTRSPASGRSRSTRWSTWHRPIAA